MRPFDLLIIAHFYFCHTEQPLSGLDVSLKIWVSPDQKQSESPHYLWHSNSRHAVPTLDLLTITRVLLDQMTSIIYFEQMFLCLLLVNNAFYSNQI